MKEQINDYLHYLNIERGLSANTRQSYERDLEQYLHFLQEQKIASWQDVDRFLVIRFLEKLHEEKKATATVTRMISSLRRFHQFYGKSVSLIMIRCNISIRRRKHRNYQVH